MADPILKLGNDVWAVRGGSESDRGAALAYNDQNSQYKSIPILHKRLGGGSYVDRDGLIKYAGMHEPRVDFLNNSKGHLLLEPSSTNLLDYSEDFDNWSGGLATANQAISPDGNLTADKLTKTSAFSAQSNSFTGTSGNNYVFSVFVKVDTGTNITLRQASGSNDVRRYFQLSDETSGQAGGNQTGFVSEGIEKYPNGWYRVHTICTSNSTAISVNLYAGRAGSTTYDGEIYIWGAMVEQKSFQTSYIPTDSYVVTRTNDDPIRSANEYILEGCNTEGVLFIECSLFTNSGENNYFSIGDTTGTRDSVELHFRSESNRIRGIIYSNNSVTVNISTYAFDKTNNNKIAFKYKENDFAIWINGTEAITSSSGSAPLKISNIQFADANVGNDWYGKCKQVLVFNEALSDSELQALTS
jgi:hypothetical protein